MKKYLSLILFFTLWTSTAFANTCAWVSGSTANWNSPAAWATCGGTFPQATDDATISGTGTLTINGTSGSPSLARGVDFTGFTGTLTSGSTAVWDIGDPAGSGAGVFTLVSGMTSSLNSATTINFVSITGTTNLSTGTKTMPIVVFNGVGGKWALQDNYVGATNRLTTLTAGTLDMNGHNLTLQGGFTSATGSTRALLMSSGTLDLNGSGTTFSMGTLASGLTITAGTSTITLPFNTVTIALGDQTYNTLNGSVGGGAPIQTLTGDFTAASYSVTPNSVQAFTLEFAGNPTFTTSFTVSAFGNNVRAFIRSSVRGTRRTITSASNTFAYADFQDIVGAGAGSWNLVAITGLSGDCGNNSGITFTTPTIIYAKTGSNQLNWSNAYWFTSSGGSTGTHMPLPQDTAIFDVNSITAGSVRLDITVSRIGAVNFTGVAHTPLLNGGAEVYGSVTLVSGMTVGGGSNFTYASQNNSTFTTGGQTIPWPLIIDAATGSLTLGDNFATTNYLYVVSGTFDEGSHTYTGTGGSASYELAGGTANINGASSFATTGIIDGATANITANMSNTTTLTYSSGTVNLSAQLASTGNATVSGGTTNNTGTAEELKSSGSLTISGGTHVLKKITAGTTLTLSGTSAVTVPPGGSLSWGTGSNLTITPNSESLIIQGSPTFTGSSMVISAQGSYTYGP